MAVLLENAFSIIFNWRVFLTYFSLRGMKTLVMIIVSFIVVAVFNIDGSYFAIEDVCTHDGGVLTGGPIEGDQIVCPRHGARFCIRTGEALTAPAFEATARFPVRLNGSDIQVRDDRWD